MYALIVCLLAKRIIPFITVLFVGFQIHGQIKWDGGGGDGFWNTPANWTGDIIPGATDDVLLDHSIFPGNYIVMLPSGANAVSVRTLTISPSATQTIEVRLPVTNTAIPAFTATGSVYGLVIGDGGIFRNSSGASVGTPVDVSDSIRIHNGGLFIHNTSRAHAGNVAVLSRSPGTEQGSFEFDVPGGAGYTVSIAGRVYGNLILSAAAAGGTKSYTSTGATAVNINGQFRLKPGANYSLNFNGGFIIHGDFIHEGNIFDVSGGLNSNRINVRKNVSVSGIVTETGTGFPIIEFDGIVTQSISMAGAIVESITIRVNNAAGVTLQSPVTISHKLELVSGNIRTTSANILTIHDNTSCTGGSVNSFVEGPMIKRGDDDFQFPIGRQGSYAAASISGTGGNIDDEFEAEYFLGSPGSTFGSTIENPPMVRISGLEYWTIDRVVGIATKKITLSVGTLSDATSLEKLIVARWDVPGNLWKDAGNTAYSGISTGTVTSNDLPLFGVFTIASTVQNQNPLPLVHILFNATSGDNRAVLRWRVDPMLEAQRFEILRSEDKFHFRMIKTMPAFSNMKEYEFVETLLTEGTYHYKIIMIGKNGSVYQSSVRSIVSDQPGIHLQVAAANSTIHLTLTAPEPTMVDIVILNAEGQTVRKITTQRHGRSQNLAIDISAMPAGVYYVTAVANRMRTNVVRFVKL